MHSSQQAHLLEEFRTWRSGCCWRIGLRMAHNVKWLDVLDGHRKLRRSVLR